MLALRGCGLVAFFLFECWLTASATAAEFYASPSGTRQAAGSREDPWDLATALAKTDSLGPGDTLWLLGGTYRGSFTCRLAGEKDRPVTIRQAPGQRATIDCRAEAGRDPLFAVAGDYATLWGFEVTCSDPLRETKTAGPWPSDIKRGGIFCRASHARFINLVVHDTANGFGFWADGEGGEIYGCLIYYNGWRGPDRGHGHGIYAQNERGTKRIVDNILFNQFSHGIHCYGSQKSALDNFHIEGNILFNPGSLTSAQDRAPAILLGGDCPVRGAVVRGNMTWADVPGTTLRLGYPWGPENVDAVVEQNYLSGSVQVKDFQQLTFARNHLVADETLIHLQHTGDEPPNEYRWDDNHYVRRLRRYSAFNLVLNRKSDGSDFEAWRRRTGFDAHSEFHQQQPSGVRTFVRPNEYEKGRAHIAIYNWDEKREVAVPLGDLLGMGQRYRIQAADDPFGPAIVESTYDGRGVSIPMQPTSPARPVGIDDYEPAATRPRFGAFVLMAEN